MRVRIKLFAAARDAVGQDQVEVDLPDERAHIRGLKDQLQEAFPELSPLIPHVLFAVDTQYASDETALATESEIACIPPVSGG